MRVENNKLLIVALLIAGCSSAGKEREASPELKSPQEFLSHLVTISNQRFYTFTAPKPCWVAAKDIPYLISRLDSVLPSAAVVMSAESNLRLGSTEADEAAFLIQGFRQGRFPPALRSERISDQDRMEIKAWWAAGGRPNEPGALCGAPEHEADKDSGK